jgi:hypothetical protein
MVLLALFVVLEAPWLAGARGTVASQLGCRRHFEATTACLGYEPVAKKEKEE